MPTPAAGSYPLTCTATAGIDTLTLSRTLAIQEAAISYIEVIRQRPLTTATLVGSVVGYLAATTTVPALSALSLGLIRNQSELAVLGGDRGYRPSAGPCAASAASARGEVAVRTAHRLSLEINALRQAGVTTLVALARTLTERGVPTPRGGIVWTHTAVARVLGRVGA